MLRNIGQKIKRRSIQLTPDNVKFPSRTSETDNLSTSSINTSILQKGTNVKVKMILIILLENLKIMRKNTKQ